MKQFIEILQRFAQLAIISLLFGIITNSCLTLTAVAQDSKHNQTYRIGATLALSGKLAFIGEAFRQGMVLAVQEINKKYATDEAHPVLELLVEDNFGEAKNGITNVSKFIEQDKVDVIFSSFTHITQALKPVTEQNQRVLFYSSTLSDLARQSGLIFKDHYDSLEAGRVAARMAEKQKYTRIATLSEIGDACTAFESGFQEEIASGQLQWITKEKYNPGETDLRPLLLRIKQHSPTGIALCTWRDTQLVMQQMSQLGLLAIPTIHLLAQFLPVGDTTEIRNLLEKNHAISIWFGFDPAISSESLKQFRQLFFSTNQADPRPESAFGYDHINILYEAMNRCGKAPGKIVDQQCLATEIQKTEHLSITGELIKFDADGVMNRKLFPTAVVNGTWEKIIGLGSEPSPLSFRQEEFQVVRYVLHRS